MVQNADGIVLSDKKAPDDVGLVAGGNVRVSPPPAGLHLGDRAVLRVVYDRLLFLGDPCCTPGPYVVRPAP